MHKLKIDFSKPGPTSRTWAILTVMCLFLAMQQLWFGRIAQEELQLADTVNRSIAERINASLPAAPDGSNAAPAAPVPYFEEARELVRQAEFPLQPMLRNLEAAQQSGVHVIGLEIAANPTGARATIDFANYEGLQDYLDQLNAGEPTVQWRLMQTQHTPSPTGYHHAVIESRGSDLPR